MVARLANGQEASSCAVRAVFYLSLYNGGLSNFTRLSIGRPSVFLCSILGEIEAACRSVEHRLVPFQRSHDKFRGFSPPKSRFLVTRVPFRSKASMQLRIRDLAVGRSPLLTQVRHDRERRAAKSFRISSGNHRVYTTFAIEFEALRAEAGVGGSPIFPSALVRMPPALDSEFE